ncbi:MAG: glycosyltransferase family 39 protein [Tannerellaceae bacterium]|nr:glycosyltransferase family 39 protein [Tannerellaceae bacterium]
MRTTALQYLYLQKPVTMVVIICMIAVLPWIALGDFATKGEAREAAVAISMLESGDWVLPQVYADEFAYKPPMAHWLMAIFSYLQGYVSEFTARLPSALAFITLMGFVLFFFGERIKFQEAFIATLLLLTCVEFDRAGMTTRVDMLLTTFIVIGLFRLYRWENKLELSGLPLSIPILLGLATLTKGPVGIILPLFVFGVYLLILNKYSLLTICRSLLYIGVSSCFLPLIWYIAAWKQGGDDFLHVVLAENFGRFFHTSAPMINYELGHENGIWFNAVTLLAGFMPWTIFFFFSLFGLKLHKPTASFKKLCVDSWQKIRSLEKIKLFSLVALVCILFFYSIPSSKRSVYLMPAYPFIALFLAEYAIYLTEYRTKVTRIFAAFLATIAAIGLVSLTLIMFGVVNPLTIAARFTDNMNMLSTIELATESLFIHPWLSACVLIFCFLALRTVYYQMFKKINIKILYATIFLVYAMNLLIDGVIMLGIRDGRSARPFAEHILEEYPLDPTNVYVMNNLREYRNLYGLNFYMGNIFHNFEKTIPENGYFLAGEHDMEKVIQTYGDQYIFHPLTSTINPMHEIKQRAILSSFQRK